MRCGTALDVSAGGASGRLSGRGFEALGAAVPHWMRGPRRTRSIGSELLVSGRRGRGCRAAPWDVHGLVHGVRPCRPERGGELRAHFREGARRFSVCGGSASGGGSLSSDADRPEIDQKSTAGRPQINHIDITSIPERPRIDSQIHPYFTPTQTDHTDPISAWRLSAIGARASTGPQS